MRDMTFTSKLVRESHLRPMHIFIIKNSLINQNIRKSYARA
jgi:hypothetical protein